MRGAIRLNQVRRGSIVMLRPSFGDGIPTQATIHAVHKDIKNGMPGVDYGQTLETATNWAYLDQIDSVIKF